MGIFDGVLICSDIDGTLASNGVVSDENKEAISFFQSEGGLFTVSTGRYPGFVKDTLAIDVNTHVISVNGTVISDETGNNILYNQKLSIELVSRICDFVLTDFSLENFYAMDLKRMDVPFGVRPDYECNKIAFVTADEDTALELVSGLEKNFANEINISRSWKTGVETIPAQSGKGVCVKKLKEITGSKLLVCAGDYGNDITMLESADVGFAVANAIPSVKAVADRITQADVKNAIAEIIETIRNEYV